MSFLPPPPPPPPPPPSTGFSPPPRPPQPRRPIISSQSKRKHASAVEAARRKAASSSSDSDSSSGSSSSGSSSSSSSSSSSGSSSDSSSSDDGSSIPDRIPCSHTCGGCSKLIHASHITYHESRKNLHARCSPTCPCWPLLVESVSVREKVLKADGSVHVKCNHQCGCAYSAMATNIKKHEKSARVHSACNPNMPCWRLINGAPVPPIASMTAPVVVPSSGLMTCGHRCLLPKTGEPCVKRLKGNPQVHEHNFKIHRQCDESCPLFNKPLIEEQLGRLHAFLASKGSAANGQSEEETTEDETSEQTDDESMKQELADTPAAVAIKQELKGVHSIPAPPPPPPPFSPPSDSSRGSLVRELKRTRELLESEKKRRKKAESALEQERAISKMEKDRLEKEIEKIQAIEKIAKEIMAAKGKSS